MLLEKICKDVLVTNEPARVACGAPDYILTKWDIPVGYIEAKDIGKKLDDKVYKEQFDRYRNSLDNLIITNYLDFWLYRNGELMTTIQIAMIDNGTIKPLPQNFKPFIDLIIDFSTHVSQSITSPSKLAKMMAGKARMLENVIERALTSEDDSYENDTLRDQMHAFQKILIHDITPSEFADIYAQTIAYGMFAARLHDPTLETFSRQEAHELIPKSNPFLRRLFGYIAGADIDERIIWIVDALADIFRATDIKKLLKNFGRTTAQHDPIIHFYETFLAEYNPKLRKSRGVWYTPEPVVNFIVRAVDDILKTDFELPQGLADTSKIKIKVDDKDAGFTAGGKQRQKEIDVHRVQILDPATGTGTFLAEVIKQVHAKFENMQGIWSGYVEEHLVPRLNGFEILMASYSMAHLKLDLLLNETGYKPTGNQKRFNIFLTNSLEEYHPDTGTLFATWLSAEANEANRIKRDSPIMVVLGNPPYAVSSSNKGEWIQSLLKDYKQELNERKINLDDDYIKFIRYGQHYIEKKGEGVLAYISNNSFTDGITHRQMRKNLLETFDKIYILNLHGNSKKKETTPDGKKDENVFDIQQGVSINLFIKTTKNRQHAQIFYADLYGKRTVKNEQLSVNNLKSIEWKKLICTSPYYFFVPKNFQAKNTYEQGFKVESLFLHYASGLQTKRDAVTIHYDKQSVEAVKRDFILLPEEEIRLKYDLPKDGRDWQINLAKIDLIENNPKQIQVVYKPFDKRFTFYTGKSKGFLAYPRADVSKHILHENNLTLHTMRQLSGTKEACEVLVTKDPILDRTLYSTNGTPYMFPLYLYPEKSSLQNERIPNLDMTIVNQIAQTLKLTFSFEKSKPRNEFAPIDILDYIYSVLYSPTYRETYREFLKIDFPCIPYPTDAKIFWKLVELGSELRKVHLLESPQVEQYITSYPHAGDNIVARKIVKKDFEVIDTEKGLGRIWINDEQYFDNVPVKAWEFYIGGYQPAQKWLKDRYRRTLEFENILHYQKIIVALSETGKIMEEIDTIFEF